MSKTYCILEAERSKIVSIKQCDDGTFDVALENGEMLFFDNDPRVDGHEKGKEVYYCRTHSWPEIPPGIKLLSVNTATLVEAMQSLFPEAVDVKIVTPEELQVLQPPKEIIN